MSNNITQVIITEEAKNDITVIIDFISRDNVKVAFDMLNIIYKTFEMLKMYPEAGIKKINIRKTSVRIYSIRKKYSIVYRELDNRLEILRVLTRYQDILAVL